MVDVTTGAFWETPEVGFLDLDFEIFFGLASWAGSWECSTSIAALEVEEIAVDGVVEITRESVKSDFGISTNSLEFLEIID